MNLDFLVYVHKYLLPKEKITKKKEKHLKKIDDIAKIPDAVLVFQDEVHYTLQSNITAMWTPRESKPKVKSYPVKDKVSYSGFVIPSTGRLFTCKPDRFNYETTIDYLRRFLKACPLNDNCKYYMIMDNAPWHKKAKRLVKENTDEKYSDIAEKIVFVYLPAYSPDLNPIEQVWRMTRADVTYNHFFDDITLLQDTLDEYYSLFDKPNLWLRSLCSFNFHYG